MKDRTHKWVDKELEKIDSQLISLYKQSTKNIRKEWDAFFERFDKAIMPFIEAIEQAQEGEIAQAKQEYKKEYLKLTIKNDAFMSMANRTAKKITETNKKASNIVNSKMNNVYVQNYNYAEKVIRKKQAQRIYIDDVDDIEPLEKNTINAFKDRRWNVKNLCSVAIRGSIGNYDKATLIAGIVSVIMQNRKSAYRNASDMFTYAENQARFDAMSKASDEGYTIEKKWSATLDNATRESHAKLDGEIVGAKEIFSNGCEYPRDPNGAPQEIYNCRCACVPVVREMPSFARMERIGDLTGSYKKDYSYKDTESNVIMNITYKEWWENRNG